MIIHLPKKFLVLKIYQPQNLQPSKFTNLKIYSLQSFFLQNLIVWQGYAEFHVPYAEATLAQAFP